MKVTDELTVTVTLSGKESLSIFNELHSLFTSQDFDIDNKEFCDLYELMNSLDENLNYEKNKERV